MVLQIGAMDPTTNGTNRYRNPGSSYHDGPAGRYRRFCYPMGQQIGAMDPSCMRILAEISYMCTYIQVHVVCGRGGYRPERRESGSEEGCR
jgi:hypothetical protein